jgi:hypothetical protein
MGPLTMVRVAPHQRAVAVALAFAWALAPVVSAVHSENHAHRYCLEHRTFEEGGAASVGKSESTERTSISGVESPSTAEAHTACPLAVPGQKTAVAELPRTDVGVSLARVSPAPVPEQGGYAPIAHLDLAPKLSPPSVPAVRV